MRHTPATTPHPQALAQVESSAAAVTCRATDYPAGWVIPPHAHGKHQLLRALELLAGGDKVIDVALALGYDSPSAFATMFRKHFGQTPSQFFQLATTAGEAAGARWQPASYN